MGNSTSVTPPRTEASSIKNIPTTKRENNSSSSQETSKILDYPDILGSEGGHNARRHGHGYWVGLDTAKLYTRGFDHQFGQELPRFLQEENCTSVIDIGAGNGYYSQYIADNTQIFVNCYDGNPDTQKISGGRCAILDFSQSLNLPCQYDWVLSIKVGKHIPAEYEKTFFDNMDRLNRKGVIINWGGAPSMNPHTPPGVPYYNQHPDSYVIQKFIELGYVQDLVAEKRIRQAATTNSTIHDRTLVFRKKPTDSEQNPS